MRYDPVSFSYPFVVNGVRITVANPYFDLTFKYSFVIIYPPPPSPGNHQKVGKNALQNSVPIR